MASPRELAARALCVRDGYFEEAAFKFHPMWMSYLLEVDAVFEAAGIDALCKAVARLEGSETHARDTGQEQSRQIQTVVALAATFAPRMILQPLLACPVR
ncbi:hypothetical protein SAMN05444161_5660 [Rhizobiales bacterium GAS191]|jgi:hypothetical protein|nr:hypothetical protein SAMN05519103_04855 [Rhizobiales bacterium GAS113]SEE17425.1 hypothetical protein SAMN05519104_5400 [Rhizobiales bacterium GAS188]SEE40514.1 hypothetical protein SAMN05444161_5660 [Rhizobiales bacterium GAS191]